MSEWYEPKEKDIEVCPEEKEVLFLVKRNEWGNVYMTLTFDQVKELYKQTGKQLDDTRIIECPVCSERFISHEDGSIDAVIGA